MGAEKVQYKKDWLTCHSKVSLGAMKQEYGVTDPATHIDFTENLPPNELPLYNMQSMYNFAQCAAYSYTFW